MSLLAPNVQGSHAPQLMLQTFPAPGGASVIPFSSDTIWGLSQAPQVKELRPTRLPHLEATAGPGHPYF